MSLEKRIELLQINRNELFDENIKLQAKVTALNELVNKAAETFKSDNLLMINLQADLKRKTEALENYGQHHSWCNSQGTGKQDYTCSCGLRKALEPQAGKE